jgi:DNA-binding NarL/FixJ family response regulator
MNAGQRPRVLLADDHRLVAEGIKGLLGSEFEVVDVVEDGRALLERTRQLKPDVIVADITMPHLNGVDALARLKQLDDRVRVVVLTMHREVAYARRALAAGALGYVLKHSAPAELITAVRAALEGKTYLTPTLAGDVLRDLRNNQQEPSDPVASLTPRQREILQLLAEGCSAKQVAASLGISARTVEFHKYQMMDRLELDSSAELVHFAIRHGIVSI